MAAKVDERVASAFAAFVDAQRVYGAQSPYAKAALRIYRKAIGTHRAPPPGMVETAGL